METKNEWAGVGTANSVLATSDNSFIVFYKGENRQHVHGMVVRPTQGWTDEGRTPFDGQSGSNVSLGEVPYSPDDDWVADN